ncbi:hypothetical protein HIM_09260 [Hirsutella minnesotensis 3608]|uniref:HMA domain-containing protein n=1 Tax=Hirsutella minnesotensis 3608 TaxID=1043627 RepID=A0A0F8A372_9HYPO|nr:hypothetical protein HIM_09260 [Hirsutella minnesotensis 3608]
MSQATTPSPGTFDLWSRLWRNRTSPATPNKALAAAHLENCVLPRVAIPTSVSGDAARVPERVTNCQACKSATAHEQDHLSEDRVPLFQTLSFASSLQTQNSVVPFEGVRVDHDAPGPLLRASVSIGGMTCASAAQTDAADPIRSMAKTVQDAGFDTCAVDTSAAVARDIDSLSQATTPSPGTFDLWSRLWRNRTSPATPNKALAAAHLENCVLPRVAIPTSVSGDAARVPERVTNCQACKSATAHEQDHLSEDRVPLFQTLSFASSLQTQNSVVPFEGVRVDHDAPGPLLRAKKVQKHPWISKIAVNPVSNSATVDFTDPERGPDIVKAIEDLGYDAVLDRVINLNEQRQSADEREVEIKVDGVFCQRCSEWSGF